MRSNPSVQLYHFPPSLCSQKVRLALAEKGVAWESTMVNIGPPMENYEPWYARINPRMVVPTLVVDAEVITDSARIVAEVDRRFPGPDLRAGDPGVQALIALQDRMPIRELAYARTSGLMGFLVKGAFEKRVKVLTRQRDAHPDLAPLYQARLDDVARWRHQSSTSEEIERGREAVARALETLEETASDAEGLVGAYSLADVTWTVLVARLHFMGWRDRMGRGLARRRVPSHAATRRGSERQGATPKHRGAP